MTQDDREWSGYCQRTIQNKANEKVYSHVKLFRFVAEFHQFTYTPVSLIDGIWIAKEKNRIMNRQEPRTESIMKGHKYTQMF